MTCKTCKYFKPQLNDKGLPILSRVGRCNYVVVWPAVPSVVFDWRPPIVSSWGAWGSSGIGCKCFEEKISQ